MSGRPKGIDVLRAVVELADDRDVTYLGSVAAWRIAGRLGGHDGRAVTANLRRLVEANLLERRDEPTLSYALYRPTASGRDVLRLYDVATASPREPLTKYLDMRALLAIR